MTEKTIDLDQRRGMAAQKATELRWLALRRKLQGAFSAGDRKELIDTVDEIAGKVRQYLGVTALTSVITGVASGLWAVTVGLELALVWGILNFLLNFIPVIGNIIGIIPPTLYAVIQFQSLPMTMVVFSGFVILQGFTGTSTLALSRRDRRGAGILELGVGHRGSAPGGAAHRRARNNL